jgi:(p)ppGpp synthase/HD superfamily hydrolase
MKTVLAKAIAIASEKHMGQFDKGGAPYVLHVLKVMHYLRTEDPELMSIGVLHDVVEDTDTTYDELRKAGMTDRIIEGIRCMTKVPGETIDEYKAKVKSNKDAILVKMCDLRHNSDIRRLKGVTEKDIKRVEKYHQFYMELKDLLGG